MTVTTDDAPEERSTEVVPMPETKPARDRRARLKQLQTDLSARANQLIATDPQACRLLGRIEELQTLLNELGEKGE